MKNKRKNSRNINKRTIRDWHPIFKDYMEYIVNHPNYNGMPAPYKKDGSIRWVVTGKSKTGKEREKWWDEKRKIKRINKEQSWKADIARKTHPTGKKPCQICGNIMSLEYVYPNKTCPYKKNTLEECDKKDCDVFKKNGNSCLHLGPGAMSDCPDRFDGFHSYNRCCRSTHDKGRHKDNLDHYGEDRRVYENWSEGNWKLSNWLMKEFNKNKLSPDHIGPISLGFCHRPKFYPTTKKLNSSWGNRLTLDKINSLIQDENKGEQVISSHSKPLWDKLKVMAKTNEDAKKIGKLMRTNLHKILTVFSNIAESGYKDFLKENFLHPKYALEKYEFKSFNPKTGEFSVNTKKALREENKRNARRYIRKSFEDLEKYKTKDNRKINFKMNELEAETLKKILKSLSEGKIDDGKKLIYELFNLFADNVRWS